MSTPPNPVRSVEAWAHDHAAAIEAMTDRYKTSPKTVTQFLSRLVLEADSDGLVDMPSNKGDLFPGWGGSQSSKNRSLRVLAALGVVLPTGPACRGASQTYRIDLSDQRQLPLERPSIDRQKVAYLASELATLVAQIEELQNQLEELSR